MTPSNYCANRLANLNCSSVIDEQGNCTVTYEGKTYTFSEFNAAFPTNAKQVRMVERSHLKGKNPDGTREWMND